MEKHPLHMKSPELQTSPEVNRAVVREERQTGEKMPNDPSERIEAYMDRLENVFLNPDEKKRERNLEMFRDKIYDAFIIKKENFPESYFELQKRIARERGQAVEEIPDNVREQMMDVAIEDQRASLNAWMEYLTSDDAMYPAWFKYFVWKNITKLSQFDKERGEFKKRTDSTVAPYPDIYREPLAQIADIYFKVKEDNKNLKEPEVREAFSQKFPSLYAELISKSLAASMENREEVKGEWKKYQQGQSGDAEQLFESLEGKGTGWCTAGKSTAETQIENGDFYVYYTNDSNGEPTQPRLAIRMEGDNRIGEVRGILPHQGVEPIMQEALDEKLQDFGTEADAYRKKSGDMKILTALDQKREQEEPFTKDDLVFLYEINSSIEGFGYQTDPRIAELRAGRNTEEDMLVIFACTKEEIAHVPSQITKDTKAYVGQLEPGIFQRLPEGLEHVYTSFPDKKIRRENVEIGGKTAEQLIAEMEAAHINISDYAKSMMKNRDFIPGKKREEATLIRLTVADLGFKTSATTDQIYERAQTLGLELCPPDTGPNYRLKYRNQPLNEWVRIGMKQIADSGGYPFVFRLVRDGDGLWLDNYWATPGLEWHPDSEFAFRLRKSES
ncbi:MAG TPA: hypothetical protein VMR49_02705 [Candidatus Paceibacterota bacterium]|nr:hypothetical protein [Candidatus Paceibacterota bacterium]